MEKNEKIYDLVVRAKQLVEAEPYEMFKVGLELVKSGKAENIEEKVLLAVLNKGGVSLTYEATGLHKPALDIGLPSTKETVEAVIASDTHQAPSLRVVHRGFGTDDEVVLTKELVGVISWLMSVYA